MNLATEIKSIIHDIQVHTIETQKFKTNTLVLKIKAPLAEEDVTKRALLPYVLQSATAKLPSALQIRSYLDDLYGASLFVDVAKKGEYHILSIRMEIANEKYLQDTTPLLEKAVELLSDILLRPHANNEAFAADIVEKEKHSLKQRIQSVYDDKIRYANMRLIEEMCANEPFRLHTHGKIEDLQAIDANNLYTYYQSVLATDEIDLYVIGDVNADEVEKKVEKYFVFPNKRNVDKRLANVAGKQPVSENVVFEQQEIKQGKLHIGLRTNITYADDDYFALQVWNGIFGGFSHSKLFLNVREKASLAYYASSRVESHKGLLFVMSGIDFRNYEQAVSIIKEQLQEMKAGNFTDKEIEQTKAVIKNQILETADTSNGLIELLYHNVIGGTNRDLEGYLYEIDRVSREQIIDVSKNINLDTIYFLKGMEGN